ncbi:YjbE family putative metal transport protein [Ferroacidibacillus organovorans]|uniref:Tellurium resistance protein TerC n=1 Tax=Ferroacidibacillus organovorans TaxID=1765683 RepID=A0A1V4ES95_9BACL|nr:YjbE family putative metal transport protein [Ferroacidibacillus organovorans]OPG15803.1 hypothetical protein B2M26_09305 [Ferroacidibacillus organovorans]
MMHALYSFFAILLTDLVLSGDNAFVIAMATLHLAPSARKRAMLYGAAVTILLRVLLTLVLGRALTWPYLQTIGGLLLLYVTYSVLFHKDLKVASDEQTKRGVLSTVATILIADLTMSADNVVAVAGIAQGNAVMTALGLLVSISLLMFASSLIARLMARLAILRWIGAGVLACTAGVMFHSDPGIAHFFGARSIYAPIFGFVLGSVLYVASRKCNVSF